LATKNKAGKKAGSSPAVGIVMGSDSDLEVMKAASAVLQQFDIPYEMTVASAHRSPRRAAEFASSADKRGIKVIIAGAGHAAPRAKNSGERVTTRDSSVIVATYLKRTLS